MKNLLLQMESKSMRDSCMRFCGRRREEREQDRQPEGDTETGREKRELGLREDLGYGGSTGGAPVPVAPLKAEG